MGRGRPRRETQGNREEEITQVIVSSSSTGTSQTDRRKITEPQLQTCERVSIGTSKEKETPNREEQWPELAKKNGSGAGKTQTPVGTNGTVTQAKPSVTTQRKLELNEVTTMTPWANLFATNRLATKGMNLNYISPVIIDGEKVVKILEEDVARDNEKWASSIVVYVVGT
ncbi:hypothetical protein KY285_001164 [Solanum tuberosum]|nr:hypothetical protein KY289_001414 [Solanum tuberosum]KAH0765293.1 hypothetical protein KY285_001164 [Solanum tuberosum]